MQCFVRSCPVQRYMQGNDIGMLQKGIQVGKARKALGSCSWRIIKQNVHAEGFGEMFHFGADMPYSNDTQGFIF
jgi:hypothetical protein